MKLARLSRILCLAFLLPAALELEAHAQRLPVIERVDPSAAAAGDVIAVLGRYFPDGATLRLGTTPLEVIDRRPGRWTARIPAGAVSGRLFVSVAGKFEVAGPEFRVTVAQAAPAIARFQPTHGAPGEEVEIHGERFSARLSENSVRIGTVPMIVRSATPTSLSVIVPAGATSGPLEVSVGHGGTVTSRTSFVVDAAPRILSFEPAIAPALSQVTIRGEGFAAASARNRVFLGAVRVPVLRATTSELVVTIPKNASTGVFVVDIVAGGRAEATAPFTVQAPPKITDFAPTGGLAGSTVKIHGEGFGDDVRRVAVKLAGAPVTVRAVRSDEVEVELPADARTGVFEVRVGDLAAAKSKEAFVVGTRMAVRSFRPASGPPGTRVVLAGVGFAPEPAANLVTLGGRSVRVVSATTEGLVLEIPEGALSGVFEVTAKGSAPARAAQPFTVSYPPVIRSFAPSEGAVGTELVVEGSRFGVAKELVEVSVAGTSLEVLSVTAERIVARIGEGVQDGKITVRVKAQGAASTVGAFHVLGEKEPAGLRSLEPECAKPGCSVVLRGAGFGALAQDNDVYFGETKLEVVRATSRELVVVLPEKVLSGVFRIVVREGAEMTSAPFVMTK
jgi:hypothetical protein